jgi:hypothetical protein
MEAETMFLEFHPDNPLRDVAWRFQLASVLVRDEVPVRRWRRYDTWVRAAAYSLRARDVPRNLRHDVAAVSSAHRVWSDSSMRLRHEFEIRILAGQANDEIASRCGLGRRVVEAYERLFFAVTERLDQIDYIACVIDPTASVWVGAAPVEVVLKKLAYGYGPVVADALVGYLDGQAPAGTDPDLDRGLRRLIAVLMLPVNEKTARAWMRATQITAILDRQEADTRVRSAARPFAVDGDLFDDILTRLAVVANNAPGTGPNREATVLAWPFLLAGFTGGSNAEELRRAVAV